VRATNRDWTGARAARYTHCMKSARRRWIARSLTVSAAAGLLLGGLGCSFSDSSKSISDSINNSSESSSSSSKDGKSAFADDVVEYTQAYVKAGARAESFLGGIGELARKRGISDWESGDATWLSIGRGLGMTKATNAELAAYENAWTGGDKQRIAAIQRGIDKVR